MAENYNLKASDDLPAELLPFKHRLTPQFYEKRKQILDFIRTDVLPALPEWRRQRKALEIEAGHPTKAPMPPKHHELQAIAKERGLMNFFLPEVCGLNCVE